MFCPLCRATCNSPTLAGVWITPDKRAVVYSVCARHSEKMLKANETERVALAERIEVALMLHEGVPLWG